MAKIGRPVKDGGTCEIRLRLSKNMWANLQELAHCETLHLSRHVTPQELIRNALKFTYIDNERLRECFRRARISGKKSFRDIS